MSSELTKMNAEMAALARAIDDQLEGKSGTMTIEVLLSVLAFKIARSPEHEFIRDQAITGIYRLTEAYQRDAATWAN